MSSAVAHAADIVEPQLHIAKGGPAAPQVALTLDACMGQTDKRILDTLVEHKIPATIFITGRWVKNNAQALDVMKAHPDLFELENHGLNHVPPIDNVPTMYGIKTAGSLAAIRAEVQGGADVVRENTGKAPHWYRGATARYSLDAVKLIEKMGYKVAGYSLNGDMGASLLAPVVEKRIAAAKDGNVIIAHINQPTRSAGEGVVKGILALKARGVHFVRLNDVQSSQTLDPVHMSKPVKTPKITAAVQLRAVN
ncbi:polysaccharide deacetylase [Phyllobacterium phragmitis]|uniref:Chitooligosaccharide deacetylase n=1 Tax=Phyllobacterium phragmitis TaxID=2670329 RepID=A0A2S9IZM6_9HYPH|nr:polysaccharide deacetylase family protein [Phyllobacterium phragmitis]PRD45982.1 polysaccharide deacetylase [Phyllobacterium phragmitis]